MTTQQSPSKIDLLSAEIIPAHLSSKGQDRFYEVFSDSGEREKFLKNPEAPTVLQAAWETNTRAFNGSEQVVKLLNIDFAAAALPDGSQPLILSFIEAPQSSTLNKADMLGANGAIAWLTKGKNADHGQRIMNIIRDLEDTDKRYVLTATDAAAALIMAGQGDEVLKIFHTGNLDDKELMVSSIHNVLDNDMQSIQNDLHFCSIARQMEEALLKLKTAPQNGKTLDI